MQQGEHPLLKAKDVCALNRLCRHRAETSLYSIVTTGIDGGGTGLSVPSSRDAPLQLSLLQELVTSSALSVPSSRDAPLQRCSSPSWHSNTPLSVPSSRDAPLQPAGSRAGRASQTSFQSSQAGTRLCSKVAQSSACHACQLSVPSSRDAPLQPEELATRQQPPRSRYSPQTFSPLLGGTLLATLLLTKIREKVKIAFSPLLSGTLLATQDGIAHLCNIPTFSSLIGGTLRATFGLAALPSLLLFQSPPGGNLLATSMWWLSKRCPASCSPLLVGTCWQPFYVLTST